MPYPLPRSERMPVCRWIARALVTLISVVPIAVVPAEAADAALPSLELGLSVEIQLRDGRDVPVFHVSIRNVSDRPVQVVDIRADDLLSWDEAPIDIRPLDPTIRLRSRSGGAYFDAPYEHMMTLAPGEGFQYVAEPNVVLEDFVQGRYRAQLRYAAGQFGDRTRFESPVVEFEIVNAPPPSAALRRTPLATEKWLVECGQFNEQRTCMIDYFSPGFETELPQPWFLGFIWQPDLRVSAHQHMICDGRPVVLTVDDNQIIEMEPGYGYHLSGAAAQQAVEQFLAGTRLTMRIHLPPDCLPRDVQIPLDGFAAAWAETQKRP